MPAKKTIQVYTDGSCHTQLCTGAWAAIIFMGDEKIILSGIENNTTHNQMELMAVIKAIEYIQKNEPVAWVTIITDSQYVTGLQARQQKFIAKNFTSKKGNEISNAALVKQLLALLDKVPVMIQKIKAHQKISAEPNYNIEADKICRSLVRHVVKGLYPKQYF